MTKEECSPSRTGTEAYLARGSRILGLATVAGALGQQAGRGPWHVLGDAIVGPTEEILTAIEEQGDTMALESAVRAAFDPAPATALPRWVLPLIADAGRFEASGALVPTALFQEVLNIPMDDLSPRVRARMALSVAFCRSRDHLDALADLFGGEEGREIIRTGTLAHVVIPPGRPSRIRGILRRTITDDPGKPNG